MNDVHSKRNGRIELLRFIAALGIAIYHFEWVYVGHPVFFVHFYIWVEFFFVLSGFFLASNCSRTQKDIKSTMPVAFNYVLIELKKLYPLYFIAFIWSFVVDHIYNWGGVKAAIIDFWQAKWEIVLCNIYMFDAEKKMYNVTSTYIASMLFTSLIIFYLVYNHRNFFICLIAPLSVMFGYGRIISLYGNLSQWMNSDGFMTASIIRAMAGMSLGALCYFVFVGILESRNILRIGVEVCSIVLIFILVVFRDRLSFNDLIVYPFVFGGLISALYTKTDVKSIEINTLFCSLGRLSYPIFLFHYGLIIVFKSCFPDRLYSMSILFIIFILVIAAIIDVLENYMHKLKKSKG